MHKRLLVVTESKFMRRVIQNYALTELSGMDVTSADSSEKAKNLIQKETWDVILSALELAGMDGIGIRNYAKRTKKNGSTPFVIMTSTDTKNQRDRLARNHVRLYLIAPFTKDELARVVTFAANDKEKRSSPRHSIPHANVILYFQDEEVEARLVNISTGGVMVEQDCSGNYANCLENARMDILFPKEYGNVRANNISTSVLRLNVISWEDEVGPVMTRSVRRFINIPSSAQKVIDEVMKQAGEEMVVGHGEIEEPF